MDPNIIDNFMHSLGISDKTVSAHYKEIITQYEIYRTSVIAQSTEDESKANNEQLLQSRAFYGNVMYVHSAPGSEWYPKGYYEPFTDNNGHLNTYTDLETALINNAKLKITYPTIPIKLVKFKFEQVVNIPRTATTTQYNKQVKTEPDTTQENNHEGKQHANLVKTERDMKHTIKNDTKQETKPYTKPVKTEQDMKQETKQYNYHDRSDEPPYDIKQEAHVSDDGDFDDNKFECSFSDILDILEKVRDPLSFPPQRQSHEANNLHSQRHRQEQPRQEQRHCNTTRARPENNRQQYIYKNPTFPPHQRHVRQKLNHDPLLRHYVSRPNHNSQQAPKQVYVLSPRELVNLVCLEQASPTAMFAILNEY